MFSAKEASEALKRYREGLLPRHREMLTREDYFQGEHWKHMKNTPVTGREPTAAYLLNAVWNKHADAMDNFPSPVFLPRSQQDTGAAKLLSRAVPALLDQMDFEGIYSDLWWNKLKQGTGCYGVFWDPVRREISVKNIELQRLFFLPSASSLQDSPYVFCLTLAKREDIEEQYPGAQLPASPTGVSDFFGEIDARELTDKVCIADCYYKTMHCGDTRVHMAKLCGDTLLYNTQDDPAYRESGLYDHGQYPFVLDCFIKKEGTPLGMGMLEIGIPSQSYIDRLDYLIEQNALIAGRQRFLVKNGAGVDEGALADLSQNFITCDLSVDSSAVRPLQAAALPAFVMEQRSAKITELKDTLGNKDFMTGGVTGGVTAYGAIVALQEAGNKLARDAIAASNRAFKEVVAQIVWLMRQFYDSPRTYYSDGAFLSLEGSSITPYLDIKIIAEKKNPFTTASHNQLVLDLYKQGGFTPAGAAGALACIEAMELEGKEEIARILRSMMERAQGGELDERGTDGFNAGDDTDIDSTLG